MPERKIELLDSRFKIHSIRRHDPMIIGGTSIGAEHIVPVFGREPKARVPKEFAVRKNGRGNWIRTSDLYTPSVAL